MSDQSWRDPGGTYTDVLTHLRELAAESIGPEGAARLCALALPSALLTAAPESGVASRLGGLPYLSSEAAWPRIGEVGLTCIAVIDLRDLQPAVLDLRLPESGFLSFFYGAQGHRPWGLEPSDRGGWSVHYAAESDAVLGIAPAGTMVLGTQPLVVTPCLSVPGWEEPAMSEIESLGDDPFDALTHALFADGWYERGHRIGGWPVLEQAPIQRHCQLASNGIEPEQWRSPAADELTADLTQWRLLAQFQLDDTLGLARGDEAPLYFAMTEQQLQQRAFDDAWVIVQHS